MYQESWITIKKDLWTMHEPELKKILQDLETERMKTDVYLSMGQSKRSNSHSVRTNITSNKKGIVVKDPRQLRKRIATLKTILNKKYPRWSDGEAR